MKKIIACLVALMLVLSGLCAFAENVEATEAPQTPDTDHLVVASTTQMSGDFFTDMWGNNTADMDVRLLLYAYNMIEWNYTYGSFVPNAAVVAQIVTEDNDDGTRSYTVEFYDDLLYSDGSPITAWDYAFSILLCAAPEMKAIGAETTDADYILGIEDYKNYSYDAENPQYNVLKGVRVLSDTELQVTVSSDYVPYFYEMGLLNYGPYPISVIAPGCMVADDGNGAYICNADEITEETETTEEIEAPIFTEELLKETVLNEETGYLSHPSVVTGPYRLLSFDGETAEFEINEYFVGRSDGQKPTIRNITFTHVTNEEAIEKLQNGEIDLLNKVTNVTTLTEARDLTVSDSFTMAGYDRSGYSFISFSCERPTVAEAEVRQAIALCLNKDELVKAYVGSNGQRVDGYYGIGQWMVQILEGKIDASSIGLNAMEETEETESEWGDLSLNLTVYNLDTDEAAAKLDQAGWTLNENGETFDPEKDSVRCKEIDGELVKLELSMIYPEGNAIGDYLQENFVDNLAKVGIRLTVEAKPMTELLEIYYRQSERDVDMIYLATNFNTVFDPSETFDPDDAYQGVNNRTGIADEALYEAAVAMRRTEPGDVLSYVKAWITFQERFTEVLPTIPVYSNTYYDVYTSNLLNYDVTSNVSWAQAIVYANLIG